MKRSLFLLFSSFSLLISCTTVDPFSNNGPTLRQQILAVTDSIESDVEHFRGKNFLRSITTVVYTQKEYGAILNSQTNTLSASNKHIINRILQTQGFMKQGHDYFGAFDSVMSVSVGGYYSTGSDSIVIVIDDNNAEFSKYLKADIFHELIHAMQDQYYDLDKIRENVHTTDHSYAIRYTVEGEAELLSTYYDYHNEYGYDAPTSEIEYEMNYMSNRAEHYLDSLHRAGNELYLSMPFLWAYYSYGPNFIQTVSGSDWSIIDSKIFKNIPSHTSEPISPTKYMSSSRQAYNVNNFDFLGTAMGRVYRVYDTDEMGTLMTAVLLREYDNAAYLNLSTKVIADRVLVAGSDNLDTMSLIWSSFWSDNSSASDFHNYYTTLYKKKLPAASSNSFVTSTSLDTSKVTCNQYPYFYSERVGNKVTVIENCPPSKLDSILLYSRAVTIDSSSAFLAKSRPQISAFSSIVNKITMSKREEIKQKSLEKSLFSQKIKRKSDM